MRYITSCKNIQTAFNRAKKKLIDKARKSGVYENFGVKEASAIEDHFIDISCYTKAENIKRAQLDTFINWCHTYEG